MAKTKRKRRVEGLRFDLTTEDIQDRMKNYAGFLREVRESMGKRLARVRAKSEEDFEAEIRASHDLDEFAKLPHDPASMKADEIQAYEQDMRLIEREAEEVLWLASRVPEGTISNVSFDDIEWLLPGLMASD